MTDNLRCSECGFTTDNRTTELLSVGDILWNEPCDERIVVIAANERNVWLRKVQKNDELAMHDGHVWAMLGKKCNVKNMCTQSYAQSMFELDGHIDQAIAATLGSESTGILDVLDLLDEIHYEDRISYDDYSRLFDAIATLGSEREKALEELVQDWQELYEYPDYGDCCRLRKRMQELGIEVIDE